MHPALELEVQVEVQVGSRLGRDLGGAPEVSDDPTAGELGRDNPSTRPVDALRLDANRVTDTWLDAWLLGDSEAMDALEAGQFPGVEVQ